jgi:hypothetical protein
MMIDDWLIIDNDWNVEVDDDWWLMLMKMLKLMMIDDDWWLILMEMLKLIMIDEWYWWKC